MSLPESPIPISATRTTTRLLDALAQPGNEPVWTVLDARYRPVIAAVTRRIGLSDADAEEAAQQTLTEFVRAFGEGRYDRSKGRLSSWILGIAHHTALRMLRTSRSRPAFGSSAVDQAIGAAAAPDGARGAEIDEASLRSIWTDERDRTILAQAMAVLRTERGVDERTVSAFELVAIRGVPVAAAASQCGMSESQVYVAKSRVVKQLKEIVAELTIAFEEDG
jgi:RNA polymerase sigma-70 factor (ECF subfamily)